MILNLTQHPATPEQREAGLMDLPTDVRQNLSALLTFDTLPTRQDIECRAIAIAAIALVYAPRDYPAVMIGGAPFLIPTLQAALEYRGLVPVFAFSRRESVEEAQSDGSVRKVSIFRHAGFVPAW